MGKESTGGLFSQGGVGGGRQSLFFGGGERLGMAKSLRSPAPAMQICRETIGPQRGARPPWGGRGQGRMPGQCSDGGRTPPPRLDPKTNPKLASAAWDLGGAGPHPSQQRARWGGVRKDLARGPQQPLIFALHGASQYPAGRGRILTPSLKAEPSHSWGFRVLP